MSVKRDPYSVFINVPFDNRYSPLFEALVFTITACGYRVRCALEEDDSGDIRIDKLDRLIRESPKSIHDLSRVELGDHDLPRFNMPFELGLALGAKRFGPGRKGDAIKIMVAEPYRLPAYLSDLGGNDPSAHRRDPSALIKIVRNFLHHAPDQTLLPGPAKLVSVFQDFREQLPRIASQMDHEVHEVQALSNYRVFLSCIAEYLKAVG